MNVLSLFDGISCGQVALQRAGIKVDKYFASEIDKYAIQVTQKNFPNTIQLGDITQVKSADLPKIDLILGGSPCQGFSLAGKQLNFDDPRSALYFEFLRLLRECSPKYFLLENVKMKREYQDTISEHLGVEPIEINSALVSAQNRKRLYWTNIPNATQPEDKGILLLDILEDGVPFCFSSSGRGNGVVEFRESSGDKAHTLTRAGYNNRAFSGAISEKSKGLVYYGSFETGRRLDDGKSLSRNFREGYRVYSTSGKAATLTSSSKGGMGGFSGLYHNRAFSEAVVSSSCSGRNPRIITETKSGKANCLTASYFKGLDADSRPGVAFKEALGKTYQDARSEIRKLTPIECERLQTLPDNYTEGISNSQRYKALGNGWTVDVIAHILKGINNG